MLVIRDGDRLPVEAYSVSYIVTRRLVFALIVGLRRMPGVGGVMGVLGSWG